MYESFMSSIESAANALLEDYALCKDIGKCHGLYMFYVEGFTSESAWMKLGVYKGSLAYQRRTVDGG